MKVAIVMGSGSDRPVMEKAAAMLDRFGIENEVRVLIRPQDSRSGHCVRRRGGRGRVRCHHRRSGKAAHLAGVMAAKSLLPVIGVPLAASLNGLDALLSTVQMPTGIPVATVAVDGAANAALLAVAILALADPDLTVRLREYRAQLAEETLQG